MAAKRLSIRKNRLDAHAARVWSPHTGSTGKVRNRMSRETECLLGTLKTCPVSGNCHSQQSLRRQGKLDAMGCLGWDPGTEKGW